MLRLILLFTILLQFKLSAQVAYIMDSKVMIDCMNCINPNFPPIFKIELLNRYSNSENIPNDIELFDDNLNPYPQSLTLRDSITYNCEKYYSYGPFYFNSESNQGTYYFVINDPNILKVAHDSSEFMLKFEIYVLSNPLFSSSNIQLSNLPSRIGKNSEPIPFF